MGSSPHLLLRGDSGTIDGAPVVIVSAGSALVFTDGSNQITGIALGDGARLSIDADVHGDIVTDLDADGTLSDGAAANDGTLLLYSSIAGITVTGNHSVFGDILAGDG